MADFNDVATNENIQAIADAVRRVTRSNASMTIPEIAAILGTLNLVEVREVEVSIEPGMTTLYGVTSYDTTIKHLFLFFPKDYVAGKVFGDIAPTVVVQASGYIDFTLARAHAEGDVKSVVMLDFLISDEATTKGYFMQNMDYMQVLNAAVSGTVKLYLHNIRIDGSGSFVKVISTDSTPYNMTSIFGSDFIFVSGSMGTNKSMIAFSNTNKGDPGAKITIANLDGNYGFEADMVDNAFFMDMQDTVTEL